MNTKSTTSRIKIKGIAATVLTALFLFSSSIIAAADRGLYRWVDSNGVVHYGDHVPAEFSKTERHVLNKQAIVVETLKAQKTKAQIQLEVEERLRQAELRRLAAEKAHRDRILLATYSGIQEIDHALLQAQEKIDGRINVVNINIANLQKQRSTILDRITYFGENADEADENTVSTLESQLDSTNDDLSSAISLRNSLKNERVDLATSYQNDKQRFVKLRLQREENTMATNHPLL